jgi:hypothetical protein
VEIHRGRTDQTLTENLTQIESQTQIETKMLKVEIHRGRIDQTLTENLTQVINQAANQVVIKTVTAVGIKTGAEEKMLPL